MIELNVFLLPDDIPPDSLGGTTAVVIDVLRATTTMVSALAKGAARVIPCLEIEEARRRASMEDGRTLLGGERRGLPIAGFDLGNSPGEYTAARVAGATIVFTTTNGTRALRHCSAAQRVLVAAFANSSAVCQQIVRCQQIAVVCAGTQGHVSLEDVLLAGRLAARCQDTSGCGVALNEQAQRAARFWRRTERRLAEAPLAAFLRRTRGGRNLVRIGLARDIDQSAQVDLFSSVPELDTVTGAVALPQLPDGPLAG